MYPQLHHFPSGVHFGDTPYVACARQCPSRSPLQRHLMLATPPDRAPSPAAETVGEKVKRWNVAVRKAIKRRGLSVPQFSDGLSITRGMLYRRLRGDAGWPLSDYLTVSDRFGLDPALGRPGLTRVRFFREDRPTEFCPEAYVASLAQLGALAAATPRLHLRVATTELPIFYLLAEPVLASLKLYLFEHTQGTGVTTRFEADAQTRHYAPLVAQATTLARTYVNLPREEIWGRAPLGDLLGQIEVLREDQLIPDEALAVICAALTRVLDRLDGEVRSLGERRLGLWYQRLHTTNPQYQLLTDDQVIHGFVTLNAPSFLTADGAAAEGLLSEHFAAARARATPLAGKVGVWEQYLSRLRAQVGRVCAG